MNKQDKPAFAALMMQIAEVYEKKMSPTLLQTYWRVLKRFDFIDVKRAVEAHVSNSKNGVFMLRPAHVVDYLEGDGEACALQALSKVESAIRHIGSYNSVVFDDPIIHAVIGDMGGWIAYCSCKNDEVPFQSHEFLKRYQIYWKRGLDRYPRCLIGRHGDSFDSHKKLPAFVGDLEKAKHVMQHGNASAILIHRNPPLLSNEMALLGFMKDDVSNDNG